MVPFLNIPILSVVLMLLAGILIGHLIWYRDRSDDEAALVGLRAENNDLLGALHDHKQAYVELESELEAQRQERDRLKAVNKQLEQSHHEIDHQRAQISSEVARLQQLKDQAFHDLDQERQQRRSLQGALTQSEENLNELRAASEQMQAQIALFHDERDELDQAAQAKLKQQDSTLEQLQLERDSARQELADHQDTLRRVQTELASREEDLRSLRKARDEANFQLDDERASREQLQQKVSQIDQLVRQRDEAMEHATTADQKIEELQKLLVTRKEAGARLEEAHAELVDSHETLQQEHDTLRQEHEAVSSTLIDERNRLSEMESELGRLLSVSAERDEAKNQAEASRELVATLRQETETHQRDLAAMRGELEETAAQLGRERHQREHLQNVLQQRRAELEAAEANLQAGEDEKSELQHALDAVSLQNQQLRQQSEALMALRGEHESVKRMLADKTQQFTELREDHEQRMARLVQLETAVNEREQKMEEFESKRQQQDSEMEALRDKLSEHADLKRTLDEKSERLDKVLAQRDEALVAEADAEQRIQTLQQDLESSKDALGVLTQQHGQMQHERGDLQEQIHSALERARSVTAQFHEARDALAATEHRLQQLETKARASEDTIRNLRRERGAILTRVRQTAVPLTGGMTSSTSDDSGGRLRRDELLGIVYTQPPKRKDDLKKITGIAQVLEKKLNAFGVYTYRQIMEWDAVAVAEFSKLLSFRRDRIDRDNWIEQARDLHFEHYGRAA